MSCRCSDISNCSKDISTLSSISDIFIGVTRKNAYSIAKSLISIYEKNSEIITPNNILILTENTLSLNSDVKSSVISMVSRCGAESSRLSALLTSMESEDKSYHESLEE